MPTELVDRYLRMLDEDITRRGQYHDHKERMAWTAVALYCPAVVVLAHRAALDFSPTVCLVFMFIVLSLLSFGALIFVHMQFECRWKAADTEAAMCRVRNRIVWLSDLELRDLCRASASNAAESETPWPELVEQELGRPPTEKRCFRAFVTKPWWCPLKWHKIDARMRTEFASYIVLVVASLLALGLLVNGCSHSTRTTRSPDGTPPALGPVNRGHATSEPSSHPGRQTADICWPASTDHCAAVAEVSRVRCGWLPVEGKDNIAYELDTVVAHLYGLSEAHPRHIFETFHEGWDYHPRLDAVLRFYRQWKGSG